MPAQEASSASQFLSFLGQAITIGVGWYVVHLLSARRDRDKARRDMLSKSADELADDSKKLLLLARAYHLGERAVAKETEIKMSIQDMALRTSALSQICNDDSVLSACRAGVQALRRSTTGKHFEDEHTGPLNEADDQFQSIAADALRAQQAFLKLKHLQFPVE